MEKVARGIRKQRQLQAEKQSFDAGQSFERLLNIQTKDGTDALTQSNCSPAMSRMDCSTCRRLTSSVELMGSLFTLSGVLA